MKSYENEDETSTSGILTGATLGTHFAGGPVTHAIETQTSKMPWVSWLGLSVISMAASATLVATRKENRGMGSFVGLWAPCFLLMGVYNKLLQIEKRLDVIEDLPSERVDIPSATAYLS